MYNQGYTSNPCSGAGYYDPSYQQYYYQQQQHQSQFANNSVGYYSPEALVMLYSQYQQHPSAYHYQPQLDYQTTPALYFLNQQAELLQKSSSKPGGQRKTRTTSGGSKGARKQRINKTLSPTPSPDCEATETGRLSLSSGGANDSSSSIGAPKRQSDCSLEPEQQSKQRKLEPPATVPVLGPCSGSKRSIFRSVALMAESSCSQ